MSALVLRRSIFHRSTPPILHIAICHSPRTFLKKRYDRECLFVYRNVPEAILASYTHPSVRHALPDILSVDAAQPNTDSDLALLC